MLSVTIFTDINGFKEAFSSFAGRIGITITEGTEDKYDSLKALRLVYNNIYTNSIGDMLFALIVILTLIAVILSFVSHTKREFLNNTVFLFIAALPLIWFAVAAQPTVIHYWFQYRTVAVTFCAIFVYVISAVSSSAMYLRIKNKLLKNIE